MGRVLTERTCSARVNWKGWLLRVDGRSDFIGNFRVVKLIIITDNQSFIKNNLYSFPTKGTFTLMIYILLSLISKLTLHRVEKRLRIKNTICLVLRATSQFEQHDFCKSFTTISAQHVVAFADHDASLLRRQCI